ncbi:MAG: hypothetical protein ACREFX_13865 [Opitutaceae bacterium]
MNNENPKSTAIPSIVAIAALVLSFVLPINPDVLAGVGTVLFLLAIVVLEYGPMLKRRLRPDRLNWK